MLVITEDLYNYMNKTIPRDLLMQLNYVAILLEDGFVEVIKNRYGRRGRATNPEHHVYMSEYALQVWEENHHRNLVKGEDK